MSLQYDLTICFTSEKRPSKIRISYYQMHILNTSQKFQEFGLGERIPTL